jgi:hypothetical protein
VSDINSGEIANREFVTSLICSEFGFRPNVMINELQINATCYRSKDRTIVEVLDSNTVFDLPYDALDKLCIKHKYRMLLLRIISASGAAISTSYPSGYGLRTLDLPVIMSEDTITAYRNYLKTYLNSNV